MTPVSDATLRDRAYKLGLYGLLARWEDVGGQPWLGTVLEFEETERRRRSLQA